MIRPDTVKIEESGSSIPASKAESLESLRISREYALEGLVAFGLKGSIWAVRRVSIFCRRARRMSRGEGVGLPTVLLLPVFEFSGALRREVVVLAAVFVFVDVVVLLVVVRFRGLKNPPRKANPKAGEVVRAIADGNRINVVSVIARSVLKRMAVTQRIKPLTLVMVFTVPDEVCGEILAN